MKTGIPQTIYLKGYTPPAFLVDLDFNFDTGPTTVRAKD